MVGGVLKSLDRKSMMGKSEKDERYYHHLAWGHVSKAPVEKVRDKSGQQVVDFSIRWRKGEFINYTAYLQTNPYAYQVAAFLRKGEPVLVCAHVREYDYVPTKGRYKNKPRTSSYGTVNFIIPLRVVSGLILSLKDTMEAPDVIEGMKYYLQDMEDEERGGAEYEPPF